MTIIRDDNGTRWVEPQERKRRRSPRALRFAEIKVGDQLMRRWEHWGGPNGGTAVWYYVVTDTWFDPVAGQNNETAGRMVAIRLLDKRTGEPHLRKEPHTLRGLASQMFHYADIDYMAHCKAARSGMAIGVVVGIGTGHAIRRRPKTPGGAL